MTAERWPALMLRETAAAYCDMSPVQFDRQCPVAPVDQGWRGLRWKRAQLDAWIEGLPERERNTLAGAAQGVDAPAPTPADNHGPTPEDRRRASLRRV